MEITYTGRKIVVLSVCMLIHGFLTEDTVLLYSGNSVSQTNLEACVAEGNEIVIADNQLTMELHG